MYHVSLDLGSLNGDMLPNDDACKTWTWRSKIVKSKIYDPLIVLLVITSSLS